MSTLKVTNIQDTSGSNSLTTAQLYNGSAKAWVNFNGTGTVSTNQTIRASFNVSSVYKNATGDYTVNFATAMADANYVVTSDSKYNNYGSMSGSGAYAMVTELARISNALQAGSVRIWGTYGYDQILYDRETVTIIVFR